MHTYAYLRIHITRTYAYIRMHTHTYAYIHIQTYTCACIHMHTCIYIYIHIYMCIHTYIQIQVHIWIRKHICHTYTHAYECIHNHAYEWSVSMRMHTYIRMHTQIGTPRMWRSSFQSKSNAIALLHYWRNKDMNTHARAYTYENKYAYDYVLGTLSRSFCSTVRLGTCDGDDG